MVGEGIPGELLIGDSPSGAVGSTPLANITCGSTTVFGEISSIPTSVLGGFVVPLFGAVSSFPTTRLLGVRLTKFGVLGVPVPRISQLLGMRLSKFPMAGLLPSYNPIRENWIRQLRGFKATKFGDWHA